MLLRMRCNCVRLCYMRSVRKVGLGTGVYVCNCNGLRERQVREAIAQGAATPAAVFRRCQSKPQCAKCVCDMRSMIEESREALRYAAE